MAVYYYRFKIDTERDASFVGHFNDITDYVNSLTVQQGLMGAWETIANPAYMELTLSNASGDFALEDEGAKYYGKLRRGNLVKAEMSSNALTWTTLAVLKIKDITPLYSQDGNHQLILKCTDILQDFLSETFIPPLQTDVRIDQILSILHDGAAALWPYETSYQFIGHTSIGDGRAPYYGADLIDFETAETTLPYYGDNLDKGQGVTVQQYLKEAVEAEIFGIYWFSMRDELFHFLSRYHASDTAVSWIVTDKIMDMPSYSYGRDLVNDFAFSYYPRAVGDAHSILYQSDNVPFSIPARSYKTLTLKYRDPNNESATVGALEVDDMVSGTDFIANQESDGSGDDWTRFISVTLYKGASSTKAVFYNRKVGDPAFMTTLQLRGTPITAYNKETVFGMNDESIAGVGLDNSLGNDRRSLTQSLSAISTTEFAQDYADFRVNTFGTPEQVLERIRIVVKENDTATKAQVLARTIGDVITVSDSIVGHERDYMIVGEIHNAIPNDGKHTVTYVVRPTNRGALFILDTSMSAAGRSMPIL